MGPPPSRRDHCLLKSTPLQRARLWVRPFGSHLAPPACPAAALGRRPPRLDSGPRHVAAQRGGVRRPRGRSREPRPTDENTTTDHLETIRRPPGPTSASTDPVPRRPPAQVGALASLRLFQSRRIGGVGAGICKVCRQLPANVQLLPCEAISRRLTSFLPAAAQSHQLPPPLAAPQVATWPAASPAPRPAPRAPSAGPCPRSRFSSLRERGEIMSSARYTLYRRRL